MQGKFSNGETYSIRAYKNAYKLTKRRDGKYLIAFVALDRCVLEQMVAEYEIKGDYFTVWCSYEVNILQPLIRQRYAEVAAELGAEYGEEVYA